MLMVRGVASVVVILIVVLGGTGGALAQPAVPTVPAKIPSAPLVGVREVVKLTSPVGFIDDVVAGDDQRLAYVIADAASRAELHVLTLATKQEQVIDLATITLHPVELALVGARMLVIGIGEDGNQTAALIELADKAKTKPAGTVVYKVPSATHITVIQRDGAPRIAVHRAVAGKADTRHEVELLALDTGRRIGGGHPIELDASGKSTKLELKVNHWSDGMTRAYGLKSGAWNRKDDQRLPDSEATYDLVTGRFVETRPIEDLFEQRKRFIALAEAATKIDFVRYLPDHSALQLWLAGRPRALELDQQLTNYDVKSLQAIVAADGTAWLGLKIDPVNPDAVARQKADPEYFDVFRIGGDGKAVRKARLLATGVRHRFGIVGDKFWLIERNNGFDRGGKSVALYQLQ